MISMSEAERGQGEGAQPTPPEPSPSGRPPVIYNDFEGFLAEVLRTLVEHGRLGPRPSGARRMAALSLAVGREAVARAFTVRIEHRGTATRVGVAAGTAVAAAVARSLRPATALTMGVAAAAAGVGWLATARGLNPLRRRYAARIAWARRQWTDNRKAWIAGQATRAEREAEVDRMVEWLCVTLDSEPLAEPPRDAAK